VQIHGGYGYMREYLVERLYRDARLYPIGGGTREIMNEIICKTEGYLRARSARGEPPRGPEEVQAPRRRAPMLTQVVRPELLVGLDALGHGTEG
jgi:hypothetical protein